MKVLYCLLDLHSLDRTEITVEVWSSADDDHGGWAGTFIVKFEIEVLGIGQEGH